MAREKEGYRENLAELREHFGGPKLLSISDVVRYCGMDHRTAKKRFGISSRGIMDTDFARLLSHLTSK